MNQTGVRFKGMSLFLVISNLIIGYFLHFSLYLIFERGKNKKSYKKSHKKIMNYQKNLYLCLVIK